MKVQYVPPKVEVHRVVLEKGIASTTSATPSTNVLEWEPDPNPQSADNRDEAWFPI
jgi:hypothetical protein